MAIFQLTPRSATRPVLIVRAPCALCARRVAVAGSPAREALMWVRSRVKTHAEPGLEPRGKAGIVRRSE